MVPKKSATKETRVYKLYVPNTKFYYTVQLNDH